MVVKKRKGLRVNWRLVFPWIMAGIFILATFFIAFSIYRTAEDSTVRQFNKEQLVLARSAANSIETLFQSYESNLRLLNNLPAVQYLDEGDYQERMITSMSELWDTPLLQIRRINTERLVAAIVDKEGLTEERGEPTLLMDYFDKAALPENRGKCFTTKVIVPKTGEIVGKQIIEMAIPTYEESTNLAHPVPTHNFAGLTAFVISLDRLAEQYVVPITAGKTGYAWLINDEGMVISHPVKEYIGRDAFAIIKEKSSDAEFERLSSIIRDRMLKGSEGTDWYVWAEDGGDIVRKVVAFAPVPVGDSSYSIAVCTPYPEVIDLIAGIRYALLLLFGAIVVTIPTGAYFLMSRIQAEDKARRRAKQLEVAYDKLNRINKELEQANLRLQELDQLKSIFLASMSHELRTPLNSIIGFTGILLQNMAGGINEEQRKQLTMVKNSAYHLLSLINDLLDISKIEAGKMELSLEKFKLDEMVEEILKTFSSAVNSKGLKLITELPVGITIFSDKRRLKQVFFNLVSNAVKFTDQGRVKIAGKIIGGEKLEISVIDTGIGIKGEDLAQLFEPFQQIDMSLTKKYEGTGLGLYLTKKLLVLLGGDISVKSEYGKGSEFTFTLPLKHKEAHRDEKSVSS